MGRWKRSIRLYIKNVIHAANRFWWRGKLWRDLLTTPIYVPESAERELNGILRCEKSEMLDRLRGLAALGSPWATATLAYCYMVPVEGESRNSQQAIGLISRSGCKNHPYVLYVWAWASLYAGDANSAMRYMLQAAIRGFEPAQVDVLHFAYNGWLGRGIDQQTLTQLCGRALKSRHKVALLYVSQVFRSGKVGGARRVMGWILTPYAVARYIIWLRINPMSRYVFVFRTQARQPFFRGLPILDAVS
jgi:hypothetical protein